MINAAVEGPSDVEAARRVIEHAGRTPGHIRVAGGKGQLDPKIAKYNKAAHVSPWVVFRDSDSKCPVELSIYLTRHISNRHPQFALRIAHSMTEAWLLADRDGCADYFKISRDIIPLDPETLPHAKDELLRLCRRSRSRDVREEMVASDGGAGPLYVLHINEFAANHWNVSAAAENSNSLRRALDRIRSM